MGLPPCPVAAAAAAISAPVAAFAIAPVPVLVAIAPSASQTQVTALVPTSSVGSSNSSFLATLGSTTERLAARYSIEGDDVEKSGRTAAARILASRAGSSNPMAQVVKPTSDTGVKSRLDMLLETLKKANQGANPAFNQALAQLQSGNVPDMVRGLRAVRGMIPNGSDAARAALAELNSVVANSTSYR